jgi:hypothetical protein
METIVKRPSVILKKKASPSPMTSEAEKKKKTGIPARVDLKIKIGFLPELKTEGKKYALIIVRSEVYGYMELFVSSKTYRKCRKSILESDKDSDHAVMIEVPFDRAERHGGKIVARGCGLQIFEKKKKLPKQQNQPLN